MRFSELLSTQTKKIDEVDVLVPTIVKNNARCVVEALKNGSDR